MFPSPNPKVSGISYVDFMSIAFIPETWCLSLCSVSGFGYLGVMRAILIIMRLYIKKSPYNSLLIVVIVHNLLVGPIFT